MPQTTPKDNYFVAIFFFTIFHSLVINKCKRCSYCHSRRECWYNNRAAVSAVIFEMS